MRDVCDEQVWLARTTSCGHSDCHGCCRCCCCVQSGYTQLPNDPFMIILYSSFLMDVQSSYQSGYMQLQVAKKLDSSFLMRFAVFSREQQHTQRSAAKGMGNQDADLVSYVEYQRNYRCVAACMPQYMPCMPFDWECYLCMILSPFSCCAAHSMLLKVHRETLANIQNFWQCLIHRTIRFRTLAHAVKSMDASIRQADRVYK